MLIKGAPEIVNEMSTFLLLNFDHLITIWNYLLNINIVIAAIWQLFVGGMLSVWYIVQY